MNTPSWLQVQLEDPNVTDLCMNGAGQTYFDRGHGMQPVVESTWESEEQLRGWVLARLSEVGKSWDAKHPFVDATIQTSPGIAHRLHSVFPPICRNGILVSLRRLPLA